jgi:hypothetical protein
MNQLHHGASLEEARLRVKVDFFWREKKSLAARGWASTSSYLHPRIIPTNVFVDDKVVVFRV